MKVAELFETEVCGRCGGSGEYSFNQVDGKRCYGCGGTGVKYTKAGAEAKAAWEAEWRTTKPVQDITVGDKVLVAGRGPKRILTVTESAADDLNPGQNRWNLTFAYPNRAGLGGCGFFVGNEVELPVTLEAKQAAYERISHLKGATGWPVEATP